MQWSITPIVAGELIDVSRSNLTLKKHEGELVRIPSIVWLLRSTEGEAILVDCGPGAQASVASQTGRAIEERALEETLRGLDVEPRVITTVVASHLHWDHAGAFASFPNAAIFVQRRELEWALEPVPAHAGLYELGADAQDPPRWQAARNRMHILEGDHTLRPGLELITLPGHSPGLMGAVVCTATGQFVIASDSIPTFENWRDRVPPGIYVDLRDVYATYDRLQAYELRRIFPGHELPDEGHVHG